MRKYFLFSLLGTVAIAACASHAATVATATASASFPPTKQTSPSLTFEATPESYVVVDITMIVRSGPGTGFDVISQIAPQKKYTVIGKYVDWWIVDLGNNESGWVYALGSQIRFLGNVNTIPEVASPPTPTPEIIPACTPANTTETSSKGLEKARSTLIMFFELLNQREYKRATALYGGDRNASR